MHPAEVEAVDGLVEVEVVVVTEEEEEEEAGVAIRRKEVTATNQLLVLLLLMPTKTIHQREVGEGKAMAKIAGDAIIITIIVITTIKIREVAAGKVVKIKVHHQNPMTNCNGKPKCGNRKPKPKH